METETQPQNNKGKTFVKFGLLAKPIDAKVTRVGAGNFGKTDIEFVANGTRTCIVSVSPKSPQHAALIDAFGSPDQWVGCTIRVGDDATFKQVNVTPVLDAKGARVQ